MSIYRKSWIALLTLLAIFFCECGALAASPANYDRNNPQLLEADHLYGDTALLIDGDTGEILFSKNSRVRMYPASTTKIMTLLLALESGKSMDEQIVIPAEAAQVPAGSSNIPVQPGDQMTFGDLLYAFMLRSGNDGANAIAVLVDGSLEAFADHMNARAEEIGCVGTHFVNAHGFHDPEHYTTAQDLAKITQTAMKNETFRKIVAAPSYSVTLTRAGQTATATLKSSDSLLQTDSDYYYRDCVGVKTGYHSQAGFCFVGAAERNGIHLISVVLHCANNNEKWQDTQKLFDYGFTCYSSYSFEALYDLAQARIGMLSVENASPNDAEGGQLRLDIDQISNADFRRMVQIGNDASLEYVVSQMIEEAEITYVRDLNAPIAEGETLANISYTAPDGQQVSAVLKASRTVEAQPEATAEPIQEMATQSAATNAPQQMPAAPKGSGVPIIIPVLLALFVILLILAIGVSRAQKRKAARRRRQMHRQREMMRREGRPNPRNDGRNVHSRPAIMAQTAIDVNIKMRRFLDFH